MSHQSHPVRPVVTIQVVMLSDGNVNVNCQTAEPTAAFHALGQALCLIAAEVKKSERPRIEIAPPAVVPLLAN